MTTPSRTIKAQPSRQGSIGRSPFSRSYLSSSPIAQESIARDLAECSDDEPEEEEPESPSSEDDSSEASTVRQDGHHHSMASSYRRPSFVAFGGTRPAVAPHKQENTFLTKKERQQSRQEERSLLRDNHLGESECLQVRTRFGSIEGWASSNL
jgi:MATE family multidrug resistance protein